MIVTKGEDGGYFDIVLPDKMDRSDISDMVPSCYTLPDDFIDIIAKIQGDRETSNAGTVPYTITSGRCLSRNNAVKMFWLDYEKKSPIKAGKIYWRTKPVMHETSDRADHDFQLTCRFSIA